MIRHKRPGVLKKCRGLWSGDSATGGRVALCASGREGGVSTFVAAPTRGGAVHTGLRGQRDGRAGEALGGEAAVERGHEKGTAVVRRSDGLEQSEQ